MYDYNHEQARMRLAGTIVGARKSFWYIEDVRIGRDNNILLVGLECPEHRNLQHLELKEINCFEYNIGYWNTNRNTYYIVRTPARQNRQGLAVENLRVVQPENLRRIQDVIGGERPLTSPGFIKMLKNEYPSFEEARSDLLTLKRPAVAVSKDIAYRYDADLEFFVLEYRGRSVAHGDIDRISLPTKFQYLREQLEHNKIKVA